MPSTPSTKSTNPKFTVFTTNNNLSAPQFMVFTNNNNLSAPQFMDFTVNTKLSPLKFTDLTINNNLLPLKFMDFTNKFTNLVASSESANNTNKFTQELMAPTVCLLSVI